MTDFLSLASFVLVVIRARLLSPLVTATIDRAADRLATWKDFLLG